jgi:hypothetical protein
MLIRKCDKSRNGRNNGDLDVAFQLFTYGMVRDGNLASKSSRDHFVRSGYAVRHDGVQALTGKGTIAFMISFAVWRSAFNIWRRHHKNPFAVSSERARRALQ